MALLVRVVVTTPGPIRLIRIQGRGEHESPSHTRAHWTGERLPSHPSPNGARCNSLGHRPGDGNGSSTHSPEGARWPARRSGLARPFGAGNLRGGPISPQSDALGW